MKRRWSGEQAVVAAGLIGVLTLSGCSGEGALPEELEQQPQTVTSSALERVEVSRGAMSCDFDLPAEMDPGGIGPIIERDRMYMSARPGMRIKHLPFSVDPGSFRVQTGGRYLFDTAENARSYLQWLRTGFLLDGFFFLSRPFFLNPRCTAWTVVGAAEFVPPPQHYFMRTERLQSPSGPGGRGLPGQWPRMLQQARRRGLAAVRLNHAPDEGRIEILHFADRSLAGVLAMAAPSLADNLVKAGWRRELDRVQLVMSIWFPFVPGDHGSAALWPNSPPLPGPSCGDGLCEVSRGESAASCGGDCPAGCGDAVCQPAGGESDRNCPGDCRLP